MSEKMKIEVDGYEAIEKTVAESGNSGRVYAPKEWIGKKVKLILLEPVEEK
jgi:putative transposon-encoded protein